MVDCILWHTVIGMILFIIQLSLPLYLKSFNDFLLLQEKFQGFTLVHKAPHDLASCCFSDFIFHYLPPSLQAILLHPC